MDPQSPPKRVTRARAAKATTEPAVKTTKIVTAAAKARATRAAAATTSTTTTTTATKRKTRSDEVDDDELQLPAVTMKSTRATRGRAKKTVEEPEPEAMETEPVAPVKATRGRPKKTAETTKEEPVRATRTTRTKKTTATEEEPASATAEPVKKTTTRSRAGTTSKPPVKKTVKFDEPEKENIAPPAVSTARSSTKASEAAASGLKAKPVRRAAGATAATKGRATRAAASTRQKEEKPSPLSPRKVNQITALNSSKGTDSEDELAFDEKTPLRASARRPIKPINLGVPKLPQQEQATTSSAENEESNNNITLHPPELGVSTVMLASPARRPPASPFKGTIKSPPRRVEGAVGLPQTSTRNEGQTTSQTPFKASLLQSPAKKAQLALNGPALSNGNAAQSNASPFKTSLLSSPAKRGLFSAVKPPVPRIQEEDAGISGGPAPKATLLATPMPTGTDGPADEDDEEMLPENNDGDAMPDSPTRLRFPGRLSAVLPRHADPALKNILLPPSQSVQEGEQATAEKEMVEGSADAMDLDEPVAEDGEARRESTTPPVSPPKNAMFGLREKDLRDYDEDNVPSDSEDELAPRRGHFPAPPATPCPAASSRTPRPRRTNSRTTESSSSSSSSGRNTAKRVKMDDKFGFTPLADQLNAWKAGPSPLKTGIKPDYSPVSGIGAAALAGGSSSSRRSRRQSSIFAQDTASPAAEGSSPVRSTTFFEDEMEVRRPEAATEQDAEMTNAEDIATPVLEDVPFTEEDVALAAEAHEMSLMEPGQVEELISSSHQTSSFDDSLSEASQEYGDENAIPVDPALLPSSATAGATPQRAPLTREFHTVSKVPLKPADESTPVRAIKIKKRGHSISRLPAQQQSPQRPGGPIRNATVISYSPTKADKQQDEVNVEERAGSEPPLPPVTPEKTEAWSTMGTPARTPRRDLNPALLRGAVVFVDVHTSEGADASGIFVELLTQMGARCVKSWSWNPSSPPSSNNNNGKDKIGITHVVYKDGGKRTLEKVRESAGVVQCVGVSWVLDCERENQWLDEAPYYIDTSLVPRGGARRRKSMEPKAIANLNGMLVPTPVRNNSRHSSGGGEQQSSTTSAPANRRDSALWIRTPEKGGRRDGERDAEGEDDDDWEEGLGGGGGGDTTSLVMDEWTVGLGGVLTPVPKTPAPEAIARFAASINPETPMSDSSYASSYNYGEDGLAENDGRLKGFSDIAAAGGARTCPPKQIVYKELGAGILAREKDDRVLMRLMAARRKSLQFAPKVGSPLAKAWN
ncbi:hypothetical protein QBC46DRAFT_357827 [Diplogelasinospora grovesii]|uniref:BRCT domain-containing protein n=1 Tax=Diplogelasinospora grovesii TaxID=303347 RepID=A0AAN6S162_9PEZI|nr:hypothetical protein QBC46DRAFT_357827 [Diplogelasinospora grovesii]